MYKDIVSYTDAGCCMLILLCVVTRNADTHDGWNRGVGKVVVMASTAKPLGPVLADGAVSALQVIGLAGLVPEVHATAAAHSCCMM